MAQSLIHRELQGGVDAISDVKTAITTRLDAASDGVANGFTRLAGQLELIHTAIEGIGRKAPVEPTLEGFRFIRLLNQVEDLVTDHKFDSGRNSDSLKKRFDEPGTQSGIDDLERLDQELARRFEAVYAPFANDHHSTLAQRYLEIDALRRDIVGRLAAPPPAAAGAPPPKATRSAKP
jgi:hypothetical protein